MVKSVLSKLVDRFLGWKIPQTFGPDCYISFDREKAVQNNGWPIGTNLLNAEEAKAMIEYLAANNPMLTEYLKGTGVSLYTYNGKVVKIVDGDTVDVLVDLGFEVYKKVRCRLAGINAPEMSTAEGKLSKEFLVTTLPLDTAVVIISREYDKYGRSVATIFIGDKNINQLMIDTNHAVVYTG